MGYPAPGHREAYRRRGISKIQVRASRTRGNQLTPEEEHQQRAAGIEPQIKAPPGPINLDKDAMHKLMDWVWKNFTNKHQAEDKKWAPSRDIPGWMRPKMQQIEQYDWKQYSPYPGYRLVVDQGNSGWKCREEMAVGTR